MADPQEADFASVDPASFQQHPSKAMQLSGIFALGHFQYHYRREEEAVLVR